MKQIKCKQCKEKFNTYYNVFCSSACYHSFYKGKPQTEKRLEKSKLSIKKATDDRKNNPIIRKKWIEKMK